MIKKLVTNVKEIALNYERDDSNFWEAVGDFIHDMSRHDVRVGKDLFDFDLKIVPSLEKNGREYTHLSVVEFHETLIETTIVLQGIGDVCNVRDNENFEMDRVGIVFILLEVVEDMVGNNELQFKEVK